MKNKIQERQDLFDAVRDGRLENVQKIIYSMGLSNLSSWNDGYDLLVQALKHHHGSIAEWLLLQNCKVNWTYPYAYCDTPLHLAVIDGNVNIVSLLLERNAYVEARSCAGNTAFQIAFFFYGVVNSEIIRLLLKYGADINAKLFYGSSIMSESCTCIGRIRNREDFLFTTNVLKLNDSSDLDFNILHFAVLLREPEWVADILSYGPDVNNKQNKAAFFSALYQSGSKIEKIIKLLKCHFSVNSEDVNNVELIFKCIRSGHTDIIKDLLKYGASIEMLCDPKYCCENSCTLLHIAVKYGRIEIIKMLVSQGCDLNATNKRGITPIYYAVKNEDTEITIFLLNIGASLLATATSSFDDFEKGRLRPLHNAILEKDVHLVKHLMEKGYYRINTKDIYGNSYLHIATDHSHSTFDEIEIVQLLLKYGANFDQGDRFGKTVLYRTVEKNNYKMASEILKYKPNVNIEMNKSAFILAIYDFPVEIVDKFRAHGFHMDHEDIKNSRLLHECVRKGYKEIHEELLSYGADPNILCDPLFCCNNRRS